MVQTANGLPGRLVFANYVTPKPCLSMRRVDLLPAAHNV